MHTEKRYKRGDVREDGMVFWQYNRAREKSEVWLSPKNYAKRKQQAQQRNQKLYCQRREDRLLRARARYEENRLLVLSYQRQNYLKTRSTRLVTAKQYRESNKKKIREYQNQWSKKNKDRLSEQRRLKLQSDILFSLRIRVRCRLQVALQRASYRKSKGTADIIGCTMQELCVHLEQQFLPGMSWEGRNLWHIDHIVPIAAGRTEEEIYLLSHYTNLRPLWGHENISKGDRLPDELPSTIHPGVRAIWLREKQHTNP